MKRVFKIVVSSSEAPIYEIGTRFTQEDNKSHFLEIEFKDEIDFNGKSLKANFIRADGVVVSTIVTKLSKITSVEVPTNALSVIGELGIELVIIQGDTVLTINKVVKLRVVSTTAGQGNTVIVGDNFLNEINKVTAELLKILNGKAEEQVKAIENKSLQERSYIQQQVDTSKKELNDIKTSAISEITNKESIIKDVATKGVEELTSTKDQAVAELTLMMKDLDVTNIITLLGNSYRGIYVHTNDYIEGDIYYKKDSSTVSFEIPNSSGVNLTKLNQTVELKKFYKLVNGMEKEFNITSNDDNSVVGFFMGNSLKLDRVNSAITFELPIITNVVAVEFQATNSTDLIKTIVLSENTPTPTIIKTQRDRPLTSSLTQRETNLRKFNY